MGKPKYTRCCITMTRDLQKRIEQFARHSDRSFSSAVRVLCSMSLDDYRKLALDSLSISPAEVDTKPRRK